MDKYNYIIIGAGIVGLSTSLKILENNPHAKIAVLEKESEIGKHQSGNNSGVIHSGIYYKPGSLKAENCRRGYKLLIDFCNKNDVDYNICGKLIVATNLSEEKYLNDLYENGKLNEIKNLKVLEKEELKKYEPYVEGIKAILVPSAGIIDYKKVMQKIVQLIQDKGVNIFFNSKVTNIIEKTENVEVVTNKQTFLTDRVISCAGLQSDRIANLTEKNLDLKIIPFRGEYYKLKSDKTHLVNSLIYPVPNPAFPFLGVHFTKKINGEIEAGPNAVFSFRREGYSRTSFSFTDTYETFMWKGFRKVASKYLSIGVGEFYRSFNKNAFVKELQKLIPSITKNDIVQGGAGVRAQACNRQGVLLDDFNLIKSKRILHVVNAPSPAATASLAIGEHIANNFIN
ncbi:MAG: L-2-hydroxyglutarate oxidase [Ignavibacteriae bacterium]|nr:L-2-hydroxyglutarate oxidase [Ignavibacteriota bacterium]